MTSIPLWLENQFAVNLLYLLGPNIEMKFHQKLKTAKAYIASKSN